jgi:Protein of unknown function (DUF2442)
MSERDRLSCPWFSLLLLFTGDAFPWFRNATIDALITIERPSPHHLYWPELDVDLAVESIEHPERYPLISRDAV